MEKIPTLFLRDPQNMKLVTQEVNPDAAWVLEGYGYPTIKKDGTNIRITIENGECIRVEKRCNPTREEKANGAEPGYVEVHRGDPADQYIFAAVDVVSNAGWPGYPDGMFSCEALGPKIQGGAEVPYYTLYPFILMPTRIVGENPRTWEEIKRYLEEHVIEGIVWHDLHLGRFAKIKRRDFNLPWPIKK